MVNVLLPLFVGTQTAAEVLTNFSTTNSKYCVPVGISLIIFYKITLRNPGL